MESPKLDDVPKYDEKINGPRVSGLGSIEGEVFDNADNLQRRLGNRQIQLIAIGGSIGTALFVSINSGLYHGGPGSLLIAYFLYSCMLGLVNNCIAEISTYMPVSGGFIRLAGMIDNSAQL
jgi:amino acid transporter